MPRSVLNRPMFAADIVLSREHWENADSYELHHLHPNVVFHGGNEDDNLTVSSSGIYGLYTKSFVEQWDECLSSRRHLSGLRRAVANPSESLRHRLENANSHFRRKASAVFGDSCALALLESLYKDVVVDISDFDACENGVSLAKLTAANFCEVGANVIHITEAGQQFIDSLRSHGSI